MNKELPANTTLSHYRIVSKIGAGGMGEVYLAHDTKLDRKVALKILPAELASNRDRMERFVREAKSAAALNHPNIATIHEIGESDGLNFIAMEFIEGVTLREKIHREQTELRKLLRYLQHAAEGLAKAHAAGIVHRDLKPDNIMITRDGHTKVLDFGLAKLIEQTPISASGSSEVATAVMRQHSTPGAIMGTVGYMSPEQAQGKTNEIDQRSDIFSFGCISNEAYQLYLRGRYSFAKRTKDEMLHAIEYYRQAVKLDPKFALAYARISETFGSMPAYPYVSPKEAFPEAKAAAQRALEIDPTLAEAHTFLAYSLIIYDWNWAEAEREFKRAIELDPNNSDAHFRYGQIYLGPMGRLDECAAEIKRGLDTEPLDINMGATLAWAYLAAGQKDKALEQARKTYDLEPRHPIGRWIMCQTYVENGMYEQAIAIAEQWLQADPTNQFALRDAGVAYARAGRRDKAEDMIRRFQDLARTQYVPACRLAAIYAALGEKDKAYEELDRAIEAHDWEMFRIKADTYWIPLRGDPKFTALLKRLNLPE